MAYGTPVVCSNTNSFPEVVGDAALTVDPLDAEALAAAIATLMNDINLCKQISTQGLQRSADFLWANTARIISNVYRTAPT